MSEIQEKQKEIEQKIDEWHKERRIVDVSKRYLPNEITSSIRIQHSGQPFTVYYDGQACKVAEDNSNEPPRKFMWSQNDVVEKVLESIEQLLNG